VDNIFWYLDKFSLLDNEISLLPDVLIYCKLFSSPSYAYIHTVHDWDGIMGASPVNFFLFTGKQNSLVKIR
jgi:hypothetical protein